jgi:hypothetical protein
VGGLDLAVSRQLLWALKLACIATVARAPAAAAAAARTCWPVSTQSVKADSPELMVIFTAAFNYSCSSRHPRA